MPCERVRVTSVAGLCAVVLLCVGTLPIGLSATRWGTAPRVPRRARAHVVSREPDLLGDGTRRLAGVVQQRSPGPGGGLCCARAGQPPGPLPVLRVQRRRLRPRQTVPPVLALRQREHATAAVQLLHGYYTTSWWPRRLLSSPRRRSVRGPRPCPWHWACERAFGGLYFSRMDCVDKEVSL